MRFKEIVYHKWAIYTINIHSMKEHYLITNIKALYRVQVTSPVIVSGLVKWGEVYQNHQLKAIQIRGHNPVIVLSNKNTEGTTH